MADREVRRLDGAFGAVLVDESQPDRGRNDQADDHRVGPFSDHEGNQRDDQQQHQQRAGQLAPQDDPWAGVVRAHRVRPDPGAATEHLLLGQPTPVAAQRAQHLVGGGTPARAIGIPRCRRPACPWIGTVEPDVARPGAKLTGGRRARAGDGGRSRDPRR